MSSFRKRPVAIEAHRWGMQNDASMPEWLRDAVVLPDVTEGAATLAVGQVTRIGADLAIHTLEGVMHAKPGDWIIRGVKGELYPCKPDIFAATYEAVES